MGIFSPLCDILHNPSTMTASEIVPTCYEHAYKKVISEVIDSTQLKKGQRQALESLPHTPIILIQGPPGAGKSFFGLSNY